MKKPEKYVPESFTKETIEKAIKNAQEDAYYEGKMTIWKAIFKNLKNLRCE